MSLLDNLEEVTECGGGPGPVTPLFFLHVCVCGRGAGNGLSNC